MEHKKTKFIITLIFAISFCLYLSAPVFAFDSFEIDPDPVCYNPADDSWVYDYRDNDYYLYGYNYSFMGWDISIPVPYYADRDHVSLYTSFSFSINNDYLTHSWCFYIAPDDEYLLRSSLNNYGYIFLQAFTQSGGSNVSSYRGTDTFDWMPNNHCDLTYCMFKHDDGFRTTFTFYCIFDLNLRYPNLELRPLRLGVWDQSQNPSYTGVDWNLYLLNNRFTVLDTQQYYLLDTMLTEISGKLDNLTVSFDTTVIERLLRDLSSNIIYYGDAIDYDLNDILDEIEDLEDDTAPDPDLTRWADQQSELNSDLDELNSLQQSYLDVLNDFTFPTVMDQTTYSGDVINRFFNIPLFMTMTFVAMSLMIVFSLLGKK